MEPTELIQSLVATWNRHNDILLLLLREIPDEGMTAKPAGSRGRDVAHQFAHLYEVRVGWLHYHATGHRLNRDEMDERVLYRAGLDVKIAQTGKDVAEWLEASLKDEKKVRMFGKDPVRWMGYLIAHESHHRGQIMLALKQSGIKMPEKVSLQGLWGSWIFG